MRRGLLMLLMAVGYTLTALGANNFIISSVEGHPGDEVTVQVDFNCDESAVVADLTIPLVEKQLTYVAGSCELNANRINGHQVTAAETDEGLRIVIYSVSLNPFVGTSGNLLSFRLRLGKDPMTYPLTGSAITGDINGNSLETTVTAGQVTILSPELTVVTTLTDYGHIPIRSRYTRNITLRNSGNETLHISDVQFTAPQFSVEQSSFSIEAGATKNVSIIYAPTERGAITESVTFISNAINGKQKATLKADPFSVNELHVNRTYGNSDEEVTITLTMNNMEPIVGMQCSFIMPEQLDYVEGSFIPSQRAASHNAHASLTDNRLTLFMYSGTNAEMSGHDGEIATFRVRLNGRNGTYYLRPTDVVLSNITIENMVSATSYGYVTIKSPTLSCANELNMGSNPVTEIVESKFTLRNTGRIPLTIDKVTFLSEGYRISDALPISIETGKSAEITVEYTPSVRGSHSTTMNIYTNDPDNRMKTVAVKGEIFEPNYIELNGEQTAEGYELIFSLDNYSQIVALQMDIESPENMITDANGITTSERLSGLAASIFEMGQNIYRVVVYSLNNKTVAGNEGEIFRVKFKGTDFLDSEVKVNNILISNARSENMASHDNLSFIVPPTLAKTVVLDKSEISFKANETATLTATILPDFATDKSIAWTSSNEKVAIVDQAGNVTAIGVGEAAITATATDGSNVSATCVAVVLPTPGDANNDGKINITDIIATASYILGNSSANFIFEAADINHSNTINVTDIIGIASIILNGGASYSPKAFSPATKSNDYIHAENFGISENQTKSLNINLNNAISYTAFQIDMHLPKGLTIENCELSERAADHTIEYQQMTDDVVRIIAYSLSNSNFSRNDGSLVKLDITADATFDGGKIIIDEIIFAEANMNEHHFDSVSIDSHYVGVDNLDKDHCKIYAVGRDIVIDSPYEQTATISQINGIVKAVSLNEGRNEIKDCEIGIYIIKTDRLTTKLIIK